MPYYQYRCECGNKFEERHSIEFGDESFCPVCNDWAKRIISAPALRGLNKGPSAHNNEVIFERPRPLQDCANTFRRMEVDGFMKKNPEFEKLAAVKMKALKEQDAAGTLGSDDYQKGRHPLQQKLC
jgi:putative FmdB family regulatory protein